MCYICSSALENAFVEETAAAGLRWRTSTCAIAISDDCPTPCVWVRFFISRLMCSYRVGVVSKPEYELCHTASVTKPPTSLYMHTLQVFNAAEMRIKGTELEKFAKSKGRASGGGTGRGTGANGRGGKTRPRGFDDTPVGGAGGAKASKWRQQSKQFRDALRQVSRQPFIGRDAS